MTCEGYYLYLFMAIFHLKLFQINVGKLSQILYKTIE